MTSVVGMPQKTLPVQARIESMYENILSPVGNSEDSGETLRHIGEFTNWADAATHLLSVIDMTRDSVTVVENTVVDALVQEGEGIIGGAGKALSTLGVEYETDVVQGSPASTIVEYAGRYECDLIVMSIHRRRGVSRYLQGSASEKIIRLSSVSALAARTQPDEQLVLPYENVLITTDGSASTTQAAQHGLALAGPFGATVYVLFVADDTSLSLDIRSAISGWEYEQTVTGTAKEIVKDTEIYGATDTIQHIEQGDPADVTLNCIDANGIHVVVMGTTGGYDAGRILFGSATEKTVRLAPVSVLTIGGVEQYVDTASRQQ